MKQLKGLAAASSLALMLALAPAASGSAYANAQQPVHATTQPESKDPHVKHPHPPFRHFHGGHIVKDTAELLGIESKVVIEQLKQGKSLLQVAQATKGWSEEEYLKKLNEKAVQNIDKAVAEGKLEAEKASRLKEVLPEKLKKMITRTWKSNSSGHPTMDYQNNQIQWVQPK
ncbi:hypothetical protein NYE70_02370 [Paenibacillus sp. FSL R5-0407]|uniref:hypothetical protein n=1 Tax=Paenibacillus sp. FSL R5-0407 TaxID=2975320 RepID=UPI0030F8B77E